MQTIALRNPVQVVLYPELVHELTKGHWGEALPHNHSEDWDKAKPVVDPDNLGRSFEPAKDNYDLLNRDVVATLLKRAHRKVKAATGEEISQRDLRRELRDMMFIMRTPRGAPLATSHQGMMSRPGRPSRTDLEGLKASRRRASPKRVARKTTRTRIAA